MPAKKAKPKLLERIVIGAKGIHCHNKKGERIFAKQGDTIWVPPNTAKSFAHILEDPKVHAARRVAKEAEAEAAAVAAKAVAEATGEAVAAEAETEEKAGGDSDES